MTFNKSLAVLGLLASIATPAAANDLSSINTTLDEARARISAWFGIPSTLASPPASSAPGLAPSVLSGSIRGASLVQAAASKAVVPAQVRANAVRISGTQTVSTIAVLATAPLAKTTQVSTPAAPAVETGSSFVSTAVATASATIDSGFASLASLISPAVQPAVTKTSNTTVASTSGLSKAAATASTPKAQVAAESRTAAAVELATELVSTLVDATKSTATSVATAVQKTATSAATALGSAASGLVASVQEALAGSSEGVSRNQLKTAIAVGMGPAVLSPEPAPAPEPAPQQPTISNPPSDGGDEPAKPDTQLPEEEPDTLNIVTGNGTVYYVDFAAGSDSSSGKSPSQAWKHAPGDSAATGSAATAALKGGDTVRFKAGTPYRGTIALKHSGQPGSPIIYTGTGFGTGQAILDGADNVTSAVPCTSASACGGAANWQSLRLITYKEPTIKNRKLYDATGPLFEAQSPALSDPFWDDDITQFATIPVSQAAAVESGRLENAALAAAASGQTNARVSIWVSGNLMAERAITSVSGNTIYFEPNGLKTYKDRDGKAAIVGSVKSLAKPGLYAVIGAGKAVVYPRSNGGSQYFVGSGRQFVNLNGKSDIMIHGFEFVRGTASLGSIREGVGVANYGKAVSNIRIENNSFSNFSMQNGYGMVMLNTVTNLVLRNNRLINLEGASGFRFGNQVSNLTIAGNVMRKVGRTGIFLGGVKTATVSGNILSQFSGVHGNGMSYYEKNANITVSGNCVFDTIRPLTFNGGGKGGDPNNLRFIGNILVANEAGTSSTHSWGAYTEGLVFDNNVALGRKAGFILNSKDTGVSITRNRMAGMAINGSKTPPSGWTVSGNDSTAKYADKADATLQENRCSARGTQGTISIGVD